MADRFTIRFTEPERTAIRKQASLRQMSESLFIRLCVRAAMDLDGDSEMLRLLRVTGDPQSTAVKD